MQFSVNYCSRQQPEYDSNNKFKCCGFTHMFTDSVDIKSCMYRCKVGKMGREKNWQGANIAI